MPVKTTPNGDDLMNWKLRTLATSLLALAITVGVGAADPVPVNEREAAQKAILDLSNKLDAKNVSELAKKIVQDHDSCDISSVFQLRRGLGIGKITELGIPNSLERFFRETANRKTLTEADLEKYRDDYLRVAKVMQAMAELAPHRATDSMLKDEKRLAAWYRVSADFKVKTADFRLAVEQADPKKTRVAAIAMNQVCSDCHQVRD
jgi:cytochrome c556